MPKTRSKVLRSLSLQWLKDYRSIKKINQKNHQNKFVKNYIKKKFLKKNSPKKNRQKICQKNLSKKFVKKFIKKKSCRKISQQNSSKNLSNKVCNTKNLAMRRIINLLGKSWTKLGS